MTDKESVVSLSVAQIQSARYKEEKRSKSLCKKCRKNGVLHEPREDGREPWIENSNDGLSFSVAVVDLDHLPADFRTRVNVSVSKKYMEPRDPSQTLDIIREAAKLGLTPPIEYRRANSPPG
jgi:hypothetical protein